MIKSATFSSESPSRPTRVRHLVVALATAMSVLLYLDRFCVSFAADYIREDLGLTQTHMSWFLSVFFWSYALAQVPSGWLADRFGARLMLTTYVVAWSLFTAQVGLVAGFVMLLVARLGCGLGQAGAYPTCGGVISRWIPVSKRATASAWVGLGGRMGGAIAPLLTAFLMVVFVPVETPVEFTAADLLDAERFCAKIQPLSDKTRETARGVALREATVENPFQESAAKSVYLRIQLFFKSDPISKLIREHWRSDRSIEQVSEAVANSLEKKVTQVAGAAGQHVKNSFLKGLTEATLSEITHMAEEFRATELRGMVLQHRNALGLNEADVSADSKPELAANRRAQLVKSLNSLLVQVDLFEEEAFGKSNLPREGIGYAKRLKAGGELSKNELGRLNRLLIEAAFPGEIRKLYCLGWRPVMVVYGLSGMLVAVAIWVVFRERPEQHSWVNAGERSLIEVGRLPDTARPGRVGRLPLRPFLTSLSLWSNCACQVGTNIGWLFLVTWLSRYFIEVHNVPILERGVLVMMPSLIGMCGGFLGGRWCDWLLPRIGLRGSRRLPPVVTRFVAAGGYGLCLIFAALPEDSPLNSPWAFTIAFSLVYFAVDLGQSAVWAYAQDAGGKYVASVLGWGNMWGNLGAAISLPLYNLILGEMPTLREWNHLFWLGLASFSLAGLCAWGMDATKPIFPPAPATEGNSPTERSA